MGSYSCKPTEVDRFYHEATRDHESEEPSLRDHHPGRWFVPGPQSQLRGTIQSAYLLFLIPILPSVLIKCLHRQWQTYYLWNRRWRLFVRSVGKKGARESTCTQRRCSDRRLRGIPTSHCTFWLVPSPAHLLTHLNVSFRTSSDHLPP